MAYRKNTGLRNAQADALGALFDGGTLNIYTGTQPASANDAATGTLLCTIDLPTPAFGAAASGVISKAGTWQATALDDGTAGWGRFVSSDTNKRIDVSVAESAADVIIDDDAIVDLGVVTVTACTITVPAS
jgi:hypothetical protein